MVALSDDSLRMQAPVMSYLDLLIVLYGASAFPVEAKAHEVDAEHTRQGLDTRPLHCGSLKSHTHLI